MANPVHTERYRRQKESISVLGVLHREGSCGGNATRGPTGEVWGQTHGIRTRRTVNCWAAIHLCTHRGWGAAPGDNEGAKEWRLFPQLMLIGKC